MLALVHPTGNEFVRNALRAFASENMLARYYTSLWWDPDAPVNAVFPASVRSALSRRAYPDNVKGLISVCPWRELGRIFCSNTGLGFFTRHERGVFSVDSVYHSVDSCAAGRLKTPGLVRGVYAYEDASLKTFRAAKSMGLKCIYDLPIAHWRFGRKLLEEERSLAPEWAPTIADSVDSDAKLERKDEELRLADLIITPSRFAAAAMKDAPALRSAVRVVPFGSDKQETTPKAKKTPSRLKAVFVGRLTQRKGISYLFEALRKASPAAELTVVGKKPAARCPALEKELARHRWIPSLPHDMLLEEISRHDILVMPSLLEGLSLAIPEALSRGLPVIATPNSGAEDIVKDGENGFIVPVRSPESIAEKLVLLHKDGERLSAMSAAALESSAVHSWASYRQRIIEEVKNIL